MDFVQWLMPLSGRISLRVRPSWAPGRSSEVDGPDVVSRFGSTFAALRWCALLLAVAVGVSEHVGGRAGLAGAVLGTYALWRTFHPISSVGSGWKTMGSLLLEVAVGVAVVEVTGFGSSPYLVCLGVSTAIAGFTGGLRVVTGVTALAAGAIVVPALILVSDRGVANLSIEVGSILVLVAVGGVFSRHVVDDARRVEVSLVARVTHLAEVNDLLLDLHRETEGRFTSMTLDAIARWGTDRLDHLFSAETAVVVLLDPETHTWHMAAGHGVANWEAHHLAELPMPLRTAVQANHPVVLEDIRDGLGFRSRWAIYCPLEARGEIVGVLGVEDRAARGATPDALRHVMDLARAAAMAVDNAHWLAEIHERGAERERSRLARELHDHMGQSVVYLGFELDRLVELNEGRAVRTDLLTLRQDMHELAGDLRGTLVGLRCDVSPDPRGRRPPAGVPGPGGESQQDHHHHEMRGPSPARSLGGAAVLERRQRGRHQRRAPR